VASPLGAPAGPELEQADEKRRVKKTIELLARAGRMHVVVQLVCHRTPTLRVGPPSVSNLDMERDHVVAAHVLDPHAVGQLEPNSDKALSFLGPAHPRPIQPGVWP
jgi:hypothetical protein